MQLKEKEPEEQVEALNGGAEDAAPQNGMVSNNGFIGEQPPLDEEELDMFGNPIHFEKPSEEVSGSGNAGAYGGAGAYGNTGAYGGAGTYGGVGNPGDNGDIYDPMKATPGVYEKPAPTERPRKLTQKEFFQSPRNRKDRDRIIISGIVVIATAIFDIIRVDFWLSALEKQIEYVNNLAETMGLEEYVIDTHKIMTAQVVFSVLLILLALGILIYKSRVCALAGFAIAVVNCVSTFVQSGSFKFYWTTIAFGYAVVATFSFAKAWKDYEENGDWKKDW